MAVSRISKETPHETRAGGGGGGGVLVWCLSRSFDQRIPFEKDTSNSWALIPVNGVGLQTEPSKIAQQLPVGWTLVEVLACSVRGGISRKKKGSRHIAIIYREHGKEYQLRVFGGCLAEQKRSTEKVLIG